MTTIAGVQHHTEFTHGGLEHLTDIVKRHTLDLLKSERQRINNFKALATHHSIQHLILRTNFLMNIL